MKPKFSNIFSDAEVGSLDGGVERIYISKHSRGMRVVLDAPPDDELIREAGKKLKDYYRLNKLDITSKEKRKYQADNVMVVTRKKSGLPIEVKPETEAAEVVDALYGRPIRHGSVPISSVNENAGRVAVTGKVFGAECKDIKSKKNDKEWYIVTFDITDYTDSISVQLFLKKPDKEEEYLKLKERLSSGVKKNNLYVSVLGTPKYNEYSREVILNATAVCEVPEPGVRADDAEEKRVELHMHTKMSSMDGVSSASELINRAISWGHKAIAITDHGVVQSFPEAMKASDLNEKIKVIYGMEGYLIDDGKRIVYNSAAQTVRSDFVVFDIETTGLSKDKNHITEIGAVKVSDGAIVDKWSTFVNPGEPIPPNIVALTSITDDMVKDAPRIDEILGDFFEFCKGCVLVAHNASFDIGFIRKAAEDMGLGFGFTYLDTLQLARCMYPTLHNHKLDTLTKHLNIILENHHRAVDDAKATAEIFVKMCEQLENENKTELDELDEIYDVAQASKKTRAYHVILLAKNQVGLRHLYELISASQLKYYFRTPRIPKSLLQKKREGLIIGSACEAGELFRAVVDGKNEKELEEIASFYDYLEIQPIGNNSYMKRSDDHPDINTDDDLRELNKKVVRLGEKLEKPVAATCDVHFMDPSGADFRKILMHYKGFKDADEQAPLYLRTTEEMLAEFDYLGEEKAREVVVKNTNLIADMVENVRPIPKEKCPPEIEGAKEDIVNDSMRRAQEIYGDPLPQIVQERLDKELYSITTYGFEVMYKIAQELVQKSLSDGYLVGSRGSVGSSLVAFLSGITEVNSLPAHYICPNCKKAEFVEDGSGISGCDLPDKICPNCGTAYKKDGHDIPFETFLGFKGDKEPDIDLNFSGEYQPTIHKYTEELFGEGHVFRAGTIGTVAEKTAFGYVQRYCEDKGIQMKNAEKKRLATGCVGVKRTTGQHPGGIIVVPHKNDIHEFCPIQHPADDPNSSIITTHFEYHSIDQNLLKLDELGHDDPTVIRMLMDLTGVDAQQIDIGDKETMSLFTSNKALNIQDGKDIGTTVGTYGVPEFGTSFVRQMLLDTKPTTFSELARISGLSHGTDVWLNNAQDLVRSGITTLSEAICTRDDIMIYLIHMGVEAGHSFKIMESVRKGKGLKPEDEDAMRAANVPDWYIDSCKKIKYMFPKAHAVAYVTMAFRIAYFKVHYPQAFYIAYFSVRADDFDSSVMARGEEVAREAMKELLAKKKNGSISPKEENLIPILEICIEMYARGLSFLPIDLYKSHATEFQPCDDGILPPLNALPGLGENVARSITEARADGPFRTIDDFKKRTGATKTNLETLTENHCLDGMPESDQVSIFELC
jgi:DNA polymerase-3 subunit alpha (Gram-positive type)